MSKMSAKKDPAGQPSGLPPQPKSHRLRLLRSRSSRITGRLALLVAALAVAAGAFAAAATATPAQASGTHHVAKVISVSAASPNPAAAGRVGWQGTRTYNVPPGLGSLNYHYACPTGLVALNGAYAIIGVPAQATGGGDTVAADRPDSNYSQWAFNFNWQLSNRGAGAPSGESIQFDLYCTRGPA
jgi:hypothetical protein